MDRTALLDEIVNYAGTDLLCYRAPVAPPPLGGSANDPPDRYAGGGHQMAQPLPDNGPHLTSPLKGEEFPRNDELRAQQNAAFDPVLAWAAKEYGIVLAITDGLMPVAQPEASLGAVRAVFTATDDTLLLALERLTRLFGSAVLTLAVWKGFLTLDAAIAMSRLDEQAQADRYGMDEEVAAKWAATDKTIRETAFFLTGKLLN